VPPTPWTVTQPDQYELAVRIGQAWIELRRVSTTVVLRDFLLGIGDDALEQGQMDTLDVHSRRNRRGG
jgi:hypothetical protein